MTEAWASITGFTGLYSVSDLGRVRNDRSDRLLIGCLSGNGYRAVVLGGRSAPPIRRYIHEIVLTTFVGPRPVGLEGCHNNGVKEDNQLANLRWDTRKNNHADKRLHGTHPAGENHAGSRLTEKDVIEIRDLAAAGAVQRLLCQRFGVSPMTISRVVNRILWTHVQ